MREIRGVNGGMRLGVRRCNVYASAREGARAADAEGDPHAVVFARKELACVFWVGWVGADREQDELADGFFRVEELAGE